MCQYYNSFSVVVSVSLVKVRDHSYKFISAKPFAPNLGAEIYGVDLSEPISEEQYGDIHA